MNATRRFLLFPLLLLLAGATAASASAPEPQEPAFAMQLFPPELVMQHQQRLGLDEAQRTAITSAIKQLQSEVLDLQWQMQQEQERLNALIKPSPIDANAALAQLDRLLDIERQVKKAHVGLLIRIRNTLTPEQQAILRPLRGLGQGNSSP